MEMSEKPSPSSDASAAWQKSNWAGQANGWL
jgi:hypothetical protein